MSSERRAQPYHRGNALVDLLQRRIVIIDGAMGTTIRTYGMKEADIRGERVRRFEEGPAEQRRPLLASRSRR
jgi:methionine synthase I (cobalamin-dependent)